LYSFGAGFRLVSVALVLFGVFVPSWMTALDDRAALFRTRIAGNNVVATGLEA
jgi:hypothetical protein